MKQNLIKLQGKLANPLELKNQQHSPIIDGIRREKSTKNVEYWNNTINDLHSNQQQHTCSSEVHAEYLLR